MGKEPKAGTGRRRGREIQYYVVVEGAPNPDVLLQNYIWCLKQRETQRADRVAVALGEEL